MLWRNHLQNALALIAMVVLIISGNPWWSLLTIFFILVPKNDDCKCDKDKR